MPRHKEATAAITHIRISQQTKQLLQDLQTRHNFKTIDAVLRYYLHESIDKPIFTTAKQLRDLTYQEPVNGIIKDAANRISKRHDNYVNNHRLDHTRTKPSQHNRWQQRRNF